MNPPTTPDRPTQLHTTYAPGRVIDIDEQIIHDNSTIPVLNLGPQNYTMADNDINIINMNNYVNNNHVITILSDAGHADPFVYNIVINTPHLPTIAVPPQAPIRNIHEHNQNNDMDDTVRVLNFEQ
jgi:hypothetical protein